MQPFIQRQSSCNKSTKRCVQAVKLNSLKEMCFYFVLKEVVQIHSPYLSCFGYARLLLRQLRSQWQHVLFYILAIQHSLSK